MKRKSTEKLAASFDVKKLTTLSMLAAVAYLVCVLFRIPCGSFLTYDMRDVFFTISGFLYGPVSTLPIIGVVCFLEMITVSESGIIGALMAFLSSAFFVVITSMVYRFRSTIFGAVLGFITGTLLMTLVMALWNILFTPIYLGLPMEGIKALMLPVILPFNLLKGVVNSGLTLLFYQPIAGILRRLGIANKVDTSKQPRHKAIFITLITVSIVLICFVPLMKWTLS